MTSGKSTKFMQLWCGTAVGTYCTQKESVTVARDAKSVVEVLLITLRGQQYLSFCGACFIALVPVQAD